MNVVADTMATETGKTAKSCPLLEGWREGLLPATAKPVEPWLRRPVLTDKLRRRILS